MCVYIYIYIQKDGLHLNTIVFIYVFEYICVFTNVFINTLLFLNLKTVYLSTLNGNNKYSCSVVQDLPATRQLIFCAQDKH